MTGPVPTRLVMIPPFIAIDRCEAVSSAMLNTTLAVRPVVEMDRRVELLGDRDLTGGERVVKFRARLGVAEQDPVRVE